MYSAEVIQEIHAALQALDPSALVLLGGSYLYKEANDRSDIDFYYIVSLWRLLFAPSVRQKIKRVKDCYQGVDAHVMIMPKFFFKHGWYYIYGHDVRGTIRHSGFNKTIIIRTALKKAYYYHLKFLLAIDSQAQQALLVRVAQQIAIVVLLADNRSTTAPLLSLRNLTNQLTERRYENIKIIAATLNWKLAGSIIPPEILADCGTALWAVLTELYNQAKTRYLDFSLINYCIYNLKFLRRGRVLFLFKNPDKMVLEKIIAGIGNPDKLGELQQEMKQIIFPVIIF